MIVPQMQHFGRSASRIADSFASESGIPFLTGKQVKEFTGKTPSQLWKQWREIGQPLVPGAEKSEVVYPARAVFRRLDELNERDSINSLHRFLFDDRFVAPAEVRNHYPGGMDPTEFKLRMDLGTVPTVYIQGKESVLDRMVPARYLREILGNTNASHGAGEVQPGIVTRATSVHVETEAGVRNLSVARRRGGWTRVIRDHPKRSGVATAGLAMAGLVMWPKQGGGQEKARGNTSKPSALESSSGAAIPGPSTVAGKESNPTEEPPRVLTPTASGTPAAGGVQSTQAKQSAEQMLRDSIARRALGEARANPPNSERPGIGRLNDEIAKYFTGIPGATPNSGWSWQGYFATWVRRDQAPIGPQGNGSLYVLGLHDWAVDTRHWLAGANARPGKGDVMLMLDRSKESAANGYNDAAVVTSVDGDKVHVVQGNDRSGDGVGKVTERTYRLGDPKIRGYITVTRQ